MADFTDRLVLAACVDIDASVNWRHSWWHSLVIAELIKVIGQSQDLGKNRPRTY